jgi:prevent-host-death family protein
VSGDQALSGVVPSWMRMIAARVEHRPIPFRQWMATCFSEPRSAQATAMAPGSTWCYIENMSNPEITQRDLRSRSREIMDAVEHGQSFTVTRDGHQIGELVPLRRRRRFVSREEFSAMSRNAPDGDLRAFRSDQDAGADHEAVSPYER